MTTIYPGQSMPNKREYKAYRFGEIEQLFCDCGATYNCETKTHASHRYHGPQTYDEHQMTLPVEWTIPDNIYFEITATATDGTIGKLIAIENKSEDWAGAATLILEIQDRKKPVRISSSYASRERNIKSMEYTKFVREVNKHPKVEKLAPINKYKQELKKGDWIIGCDNRRSLIIGKVSRWTNHNVWALQGGEGKERKLWSIPQTFLMPNDDHMKALTWAAMKGYKGN